LGTLESRAAFGNGDSKPLNFCLNAEEFTRQHFLITGMSGVGKTHAATVIIEELANKTRRPVVVLDPHGEYVGVGVAGKRMKELGAAAVKDYPFDFGVSIHAGDAEGTVKALRKSGVEVGRQSRFSVRDVSGRWLKGCDEKTEVEVKEALTEGVKRGQVKIVAAKGLAADERSSLFACCVRALWKARVEGSVEPFVLVVEDAETIDPKTLMRIASEGRKAGVSLCLLSQHPTEMSRAVLSQMGTQLMGRTTDTGDLEYLRNMAGEKCIVLPQLTTGEWVVNGITLTRPTRLFVRERYSLTV
jgi:DNA helicase HerA-like ATPase